MPKRVRIENLDKSNAEDLIFVCSSKRLSDQVHQRGVGLKRQWLQKMLDGYGSCAKIAYYDEKPAAQILYYPEDADPANASPRSDVLVLRCLYNPTSNAQKLGIGTSLLQSVIEDAKLKRTCLGKKPCRFILARVFNTGELIPLPEFYKRNGFLQTREKTAMYLPIKGTYVPPRPREVYTPLTEDRDRAVVFYDPSCQFSYQFATRTAELIKLVAPDIEIQMINQWERPEELMKRKNCAVIVNARPISAFFMEADRFKQEVACALGKSP